jgi:hypothetical protein
MIISNKNSIETNKNNYLVLYGGASPEEGVLGDSYYAILPNIDEVGKLYIIIIIIIIMHEN